MYHILLNYVEGYYSKPKLFWYIKIYSENLIAIVIDNSYEIAEGLL